MSESRRDEPVAPRRTLKGPVLPPPAASQAEEARKAEEKEQARHERAAAKTAARERRSADSARRAEAKQARRDEQQASAAAGAGAGAGDERPAGRPGRPSRTPSPDRSGSRTPRSAPDVPAAAAGGAAAGAAAGATSARSTDGGSSRDDRPARPRSQGDGGSSRGARPARGSGSKPAKRTRRAQLRLVQVDAWSVMKTSFLLSIALGIVLVVAVAVIWSVLGAAGVFTNINSVVQQAVGGESGSKFDITQYVGTSRIMGLTMIVAVIDVILITAIATLGAFLYNLSAALLGGIEVTLAEDN